MADRDAQSAARTLRNLIEGADEVIFTTEGDPDDLVTAEAFAQLSEESIRRVDASAEEAQTIRLRYLEMGSPFGLFLRSFEREAHRYSYSPDGSEASEQSALIRVAGAQSVERKIHAALHPVVPMLAIRNPWDLMTRALVPRVSVADEEWEGLVERFAGEAFLIVFDCLALGAGVSIELELLRRCGRADNTVVVLADPGDGESYGTALFEVMGRHGVEVPTSDRPSKDHPALAGFSRVAYESEIDWEHLETSELFGDLMRGAVVQDLVDLSYRRLPDRVHLTRARAKQLRAAGEFEAAAVTAQEALALAEESGVPAYIAGAHVTLGTIALDVDQHQFALAQFAIAGKMSKESGDQNGESAAAMWAGVTLERSGDPDTAVRFFLMALHLSWELKAYDDIVATLREMAPLLDQTNDETRGEPAFQKAAHVIEVLGFG